MCLVSGLLIWSSAPSSGACWFTTTFQQPNSWVLLQAFFRTSIMPSTETPASLEFLSLITILEREEAETFKCTQITKRTKRSPRGHCGSLVGKVDAEKALKNLSDRLDKHVGGTLSNDDVLEVVTSLLGSYLCKGSHIRNKDTAEIQWTRELSDNDKRIRLHEKLKIKFSEQSQEKPICSTPSSLSPPSSSTPPSTPSRSLPATPLKFKFYDESPRKSAKHERWTTGKLVTGLLLENLGSLDQEPGFIYLIGHPQEKQMVKVGHTVNLEKRLNEHKNCLGGYERISTTYIRFARRIEQLILTEFRLQRCKLVDKCDKCHAAHEEWIHAKNRGPLIKSLKKWIGFANGDRSPYEIKDERHVDSQVDLPSPAWEGVNKHSSSSRRKSSQQGNTSPSPEPTPSKTRYSQPTGDRLQVPLDSVPDGDVSESTFVDEGISDMSNGLSEGGLDVKTETGESPADSVRRTLFVPGSAS